MNLPLVMHGSSLIFEVGDDLEADIATNYALNIDKVLAELPTPVTNGIMLIVEDLQQEFSCNINIKHRSRTKLMPIRLLHVILKSHLLSLSGNTLLKKYRKAKSNLERLKGMGATILHEVDATKMKFHVHLKMRKFDIIVFNIPHAGFKGKEENIRLINLHKQLVNGFFKNASHMLRPCGEVYVHKIGVSFHRWNLKELAFSYSDQMCKF